MKIGLFFGSFNPIHVGHMIIASHMVDLTDLQQVWFVVSPHNPLKNKESLLNEYDRLHLVELAIKEDERFRTSNIEFSLPKPSYTIDTITYLTEKFPQHEFSLIMGSDNLHSLHKWKNYEVLLANNSFYVYGRENEVTHPLIEHDNVHLCKFPVLHISASYIRQCLKNNHSVKYMVPKPAFEYIEEMSLYKK